MEPIVVHLPNEKVPQSKKEDALLANCKYFHGEDECPFKDASSAEACFWNIERIATREAAIESSVMLSDAKAELSRVNLPKTITDAVPAPVIQVAFVIFGKQCSAPYWSDEFASEFEAFLRGYGLKVV